MHLPWSGNHPARSFWGPWLLPLGASAIRSGFIPKLVGCLVLIAGVGYLAIGVVFFVPPDARAATAK